MFCRGDLEHYWQYYWYGNLSPHDTAQMDDLTAKVPSSFPLLSFFDRVTPPKKDSEGTVAMTLLRRGARNMNMSAALAAGELVVLAQADKRPLPFGLEVNGTRTPGEGTVFYQMALPLDRAGTEVPTGN
jgi:hypothetical protein